MERVHAVNPPDGTDWLGLPSLAATLSTDPDVVPTMDGEMIDRLERTLEILMLVDHQADALHTRATNTDEGGAMRLAVELRSLANRVQVIGDFLLDAGERVLELEDRILEVLEERYRLHSERRLRPTG